MCLDRSEAAGSEPQRSSTDWRKSRAREPTGRRDGLRRAGPKSPLPAWRSPPIAQPRDRDPQTSDGPAPPVQGPSTGDRRAIQNWASGLDRRERPACLGKRRFGDLRRPIRAASRAGAPDRAVLVTVMTRGLPDGDMASSVYGWSLGGSRRNRHKRRHGQPRVRYGGDRRVGRGAADRAPQNGAIAPVGVGGIGPWALDPGTPRARSR